MNSGQHADNGKKVKGYLFNLIVYTNKGKHTEYMADVVRPFIEKFPCRVLFIQCDQEMEGKQMTTTPLPEGKDDESSDHFQIAVSPSLLYRIPFVILPKLVPDLPIYLVWGDNPAGENEILPQLEKWASRLVFDAEYAEDLLDFSKKMLQKITELKIDFMDIGWAKVGGWRKVLAQTFDTSDKIKHLNRCRNVIIKYNSLPDDRAGQPEVQALYIQAWLASRMGWKYSSKITQKPQQIGYELSENDLIVTLEPQERPSLTQGRVFEIEFESTDKIATMLTLAEKQSKVMVYVSTPEKCNLPLSYSIPDISKGLTAMKEVFYHPASEHYRRMLSMLAQME